MTTKRLVLPGSGEDCACGEHRKMCRFGRQHSWTMGYVPEALASNCGIDIELARRGITHCWECNAVHVPQPGEEYSSAMDEYTPGPWMRASRIRSPFGPVQDIESSGRSVIAQNIVGEANARLIAAAPDLLEALTRLLNLDDQCDYGGVPDICPGDPPLVPSPCHWCQARAAVAQARGEEVAR